MTHRFYVAPPIVGATAELADGEARHVCLVLRLEAGDLLTLFDGSGAEFVGQIEAVTRQRVRVRIVERREVDREPSRDVVLGVALPKGDRQRWLVEKAVELGVARLVPLQTQRGVAQPLEAALARLRRTVIESSKQCGRNRLMEIAPAQPLAGFLDLAAAMAETSRPVLRLLADPSGDTLPEHPPAGCQSIFAAVGPEGGFTDVELEQAGARRWHRVSLGPRTLRVETAAIAIAARYALEGRMTND